MDTAKRKKKSLNGLGEIHPWPILDRLVKDPDSPHSKRVRHILELLIELKKNVGSYAAIQTLAKLRKPIDRYRFKYHVAVGSRVSVGLATAESNPSQDDFWEYGAVRTLLEIVGKPGGLDRIRKCECGTLFVAAKRSDKTLCGSACRQRKYDRDDTRRERKRAYMKERYAELKRLEANPKSGVGLRTPSRRKKR